MGIPAIGSSTATCETGYLWEWHVGMLGVVMFGKMLELGLYCSLTTSALGVLKFSIKFASSLVAAVDVYTDVTFVYIAAACGSSIWIAALVFPLFGVLCAQFIALPIYIHYSFDSEEGYDYCQHKNLLKE